MENNPKPKPEASNTKKFFVGCLPFLIIAIGVLYAIFGLESPKTKHSLPEHSTAYSITTHMLENNAEFEKNGFNELDCPFSDYIHDYLNDSSYLIVSHFKYKNEYGVKKRFNYKARVKWLGNDPDSLKNWHMMYIEEFTPGM